MNVLVITKDNSVVKIAICGEAWGEQEERERMPFVGPSGYELTRMLDEAGIRRADCFLTNVFNMRPERNDIETLCASKKEAGTSLPPLRPAKYIKAEYLHHILRLKEELEDVRPNVVIAMGNTAAWALLGDSGITKIRGTVATSTLCPGLKVLPTFHPAAILRQWDNRPTTVLDLQKALRESAFPEARRMSRRIILDPTLADIEWFYNTYAANARVISFDIETHADQITCIGFAPTIDLCFVIPFVDWRKPGYNYWHTAEEEIVAWQWVQRLLAVPCPKLGQNGLYDIQYLWRYYGITVENYAEDSMLAHHALQPESQKGLGFLGSIYSDEPAWKFMRKKTKSFETEE